MRLYYTQIESTCVRMLEFVFLLFSVCASVAHTHSEKDTAALRATEIYDFHIRRHNQQEPDESSGARAR